MSTTKLAGADKMQGELVRAEKHLANLQPAYSDSAATVANASRSRAPRESGRLAASVKPRADARAGYAESNLPYSGVIHWGWRGHNIEPQPWLSEAAQASEPQWIRNFERLMDESLAMVRGLR